MKKIVKAQDLQVGDHATFHGLGSFSITGVVVGRDIVGVTATSLPDPTGRVAGGTESCFTRPVDSEVFVFAPAEPGQRAAGSGTFGPADPGEEDLTS